MGDIARHVLDSSGIDSNSGIDSVLAGIGFDGRGKMSIRIGN